VSKPTISIITPCYNSENFLDEMISSVISQTYKDWELIIVDDYSNDKSALVIEKYLLIENRIKLIKFENKMGPAIARNKAIEVARGRYITFLDSDDYWEINFLKYSIEKAKYYPFIYSQYNRVSEKGNYIDTISVVKKVNLDRILKGSPISCLSAFIDTSKFGKKYFPTKIFREDLGYWVKLLEDFKYAYGFNFCEANYRIHKKSSSKNKIKMSLLTWHDYRNNYNLSFIKSVYFYLYYVYRGNMKYLKLKFLSLIQFIKKIY